MDTGGRGRSGEVDHGGAAVAGATEPVTLSDPDGSVTRIAPWASWTREQVRPPGGESVLVTRLDRGQLWFTAGPGPGESAAAAAAAPWRQEVHVGPAVVTTSTGRCHVVAEPDGGATVTCLEGDVRVGTRACEPVRLTADLAAAVSADGETVVVLDGAAVRSPATAPPTAGGDRGTRAVARDRPPALIPVRRRHPTARRLQLGGPLVAGTIAVVLLVGLLAYSLVLVRDTNRSEPSASHPTVTQAAAPAAGVSPTSAAAPTVAASTPPATAPRRPPATAPPTTVAAGPPGTAVAKLTTCRRAPGGVEVVAQVAQTGGRPTRFRVQVSVRGAGDAPLGQASGETASLAPGVSTPVAVMVPVAGALGGASCQLDGTAGA